MDEQNNTPVKLDSTKKPDLTNFFSGNVVASSVILASILIGVCIIVGSFITSRGGISIGNVNNTPTTQAAAATPPTTGIKVTDRADQPTIGSATAPVTVYEFGDFQCPYCKQFFQQSFADIKTKYIDTGEVKFVFRHFPLTQIHVNAEIAAEAAECANRQGKFEAYYDTLYTNGQADGTGLDVASLKTYASQDGLDTTAFDTCLDTHATAATVAADQALGTSLGINGTPSFIINGTLIPGAEPTAQFEQVIDAALKK